MRTAAMTSAGLALLLTVVVFGGRSVLEHLLSTPLNAGGTAQLVEVPAGADARDLLERCARARIVSSNPLLSLYASWLHEPRALAPGEYQLSPALTPVQVIEQVEAGRVYEHTVTLPPGANLEQMAAVLAGAEIVDEAAFLKAAANPELLGRLGIEGPSAEGYIFPDVWALPRGLTPEALLSRLVKRVGEVGPALDRAASRLGLTSYQLVIIASLVEQGPVLPQERRLYAALLLERLQKGYALESKAADTYGRGRPDAPEDLSADPWNTTKRVGLPATPIGSPSLAALRAAADPVDTEPVFMVSRGSGRHIFCPDAACYLEALRRYRPGERPHFPKRRSTRRPR